MTFAYRMKLFRDYAKMITQLFREIFKKCQGLTAKQTIAYLQTIGSHPDVKKLADNMAERMVTAVKVDNEKTWKAAARKGTLSRQIHSSLRSNMRGSIQGVIQNIIEENSKLIRSVPADIADRISKEAMERYLKGERWEDAVADIMAKAPHLSYNHAKLIARTETSKANEAMTEARSRDIGITWYFWRSSHDERVRHSHQMMDGVLCSFDYPPDPEAFYDGGSLFGPYQAGCCPNCRCYAEPVVDIEDLPDSFKVCLGGAKPRVMGKKQFLKVM